MLGVRLYLFGYEGTLYKYHYLRLWWMSSVLKRDLEDVLAVARAYGYKMCKKGECKGFHIIVGETDA